MSTFVAMNETVPDEDPGQSSFCLQSQGESSPKIAIHHEIKERENDEKINLIHQKGLLKSNSNDSSTKRQVFGSPPPDPLSLSISNKNNTDNALNDAFREYRNSLSKPVDTNPMDEFGDKFVRTVSKIVERGKHRMELTKPRESRKSIGSNSVSCDKPHNTVSKTPHRTSDKIVQEIVKDFAPNGDRKIMRAIQRTAYVNAAVLLSTVTGGAAGAAGLVTGGALAANRLNKGVQREDETEVAKSIAAYSSGTTASIVGQVATGALLVCVAGTTVPMAGAIAFGVGCASGITAGALSEWGVEHALGRTTR